MQPDQGWNPSKSPQPADHQFSAADSASASGRRDQIPAHSPLNTTSASVDSVLWTTEVLSRPGRPYDHLYVPHYSPPQLQPGPLPPQPDYLPLSRPVVDRSHSGSSEGSSRYSDSEVWASDQASSRATFIPKLWQMLSEPEQFSEAITWTPEGSEFLLFHTSKLEQALLALFGHANIPSFTRQLNVYSFTRMPVKELRATLTRIDLTLAPDTEASGWHQKGWTRDMPPDRLSAYQPRQRVTKARTARLAAIASLPTPGASGNE